MKPGAESGVPEPERVPRLLPEHLPDGKLSIAVFGPGKGEAILVRLPNGRVGVVDGCREPADPKHPHGQGDPMRELLHALEHASDSPTEFRISFVCLTHPHDDHYAGLGRLLKAYEGRVDEVWHVNHTTPQYLDALPVWLRSTNAGKVAHPDQSKLSGLDRVIEAFHDAPRSSNTRQRLLICGRNLRKETLGGYEFNVTACGPADRDLTAAHDQLLGLMLQKIGDIDIASSHDPNLTSSAVLIRWGKAAVLLAGDLLAGKANHSGWRECREYVQGEVQVVNVAHHASDEAHDTALWASMKPRLAIVTPFMKAAGNQPPRPKDVHRLAASSVVAITSPPQWSVIAPDDPRRMAGRMPLRGGTPARASGISTTRTPGASDIRNAIAVSLDAKGTITQFVLAGQADVYLSSNE